MIREVGTGKPYATIQAALDNLFAIEGANAFIETQTIRVYGGTYNETPVPNTLLNPTATYRLVIEAATGYYPILDGNNVAALGFYVFQINYVTIKGFSVTKYTTAGIKIELSTNCVTQKNKCYGIGSAGIWFLSSTSGEAYENNCYSNTNTGINFKLSATGKIYNNNCYSNLYGIAVDQSANTIIYNNNCPLNTSSGIYINESTGCGTYNNTSYFSAIGITFNSNSTNGICKNNAIWSATGNCLYISDNSQAGFVSDYNDLYPTGTGKAGYWTVARLTLLNWQTASGQDANSISANPLFVNPGGTAAIDYRLTPASPCIKKGISLIAIFGIDYWGMERSTACDIGIHEYSISYNIAAIETEIINILSTITDLKTVIDYEPRIIPQLPAVTLFFNGFTQSQTEAVSFTVIYKWIMRLIVRLHDDEKAQDDLKAFTQLILYKFKQHLKLNGAVLFAISPSASVGAVLDKNNPVIIVEFDIEATKEED